MIEKISTALHQASKSSVEPDNARTTKWGYLFGLLVVLQALSLSLYLGKADQVGFPLDDAWIHQAYARNLGLHGMMAFSPGQPSTGSTSFGWTVLLAAGYRLDLPFLPWTYLLGSSFAIGTALAAAYLSWTYFKSLVNATLVAILCILEWHLAWASVSGMEIGFFTALTLLFFLLIHRRASPFIVGGLIGCIVLVRPEGILLSLVYLWRLHSTQRGEARHILSNAVAFLLTVLIVISPWIAFNLSFGHRPFPNTISAKFMQYGYPWSPWKSVKYAWDVLIYFLNGPLLLLVPGAVFTVYRTIRMRDVSYLHPVAWSVTLVGLYAVALPAIYDHGRYLMPLIPLVIIYGVDGLAQILRSFVRSRLLRAAVWLSVFGMALLLWINGASDYAHRIQLFHWVHMPAARWINVNVPQDAVIATHDIGIIGYYTERQIVDLAGLVTPEIVPIMDEPKKLAEFLQKSNVTYLGVYSGYYRELLDLLNAQVVFSPGAERLRAMGIEPFEIYEIVNSNE